VTTPAAPLTEPNTGDPVPTVPDPQWWELLGYDEDPDPQPDEAKVAAPLRRLRRLVDVPDIPSLPGSRYGRPGDSAYLREKGLWNDPGSGKFKRLGMSTPKAQSLRAERASSPVALAARDRGKVRARVADNRMSQAGFRKGDVVEVEYRTPDKGRVRIVSANGKRRAYDVQWERFSEVVDDIVDPTPDPTPPPEPTPVRRTELSEAEFQLDWASPQRLLAVWGAGYPVDSSPIYGREIVGDDQVSWVSRVNPDTGRRDVIGVKQAGPRVNRSRVERFTGTLPSTTDPNRPLLDQIDNLRTFNDDTLGLGELERSFKPPMALTGGSSFEDLVKAEWTGDDAEILRRFAAKVALYDELTYADDDDGDRVLLSRAEKWARLRSIDPDEVDRRAASMVLPTPYDIGMTQRGVVAAQFAVGRDDPDPDVMAFLQATRRRYLEYVDGGPDRIRLHRTPDGPNPFLGNQANRWGTDQRNERGVSGLTSWTTSVASSEGWGGLPSVSRDVPHDRVIGRFSVIDGEVLVAAHASQVEWIDNWVDPDAAAPLPDGYVDLGDPANTPLLAKFERWGEAGPDLTPEQEDIVQRVIAKGVLLRSLTRSGDGLTRADAYRQMREETSADDWSHNEWAEPKPWAAAFAHRHLIGATLSAEPGDEDPDVMAFLQLMRAHFAEQSGVDGIRLRRGSYQPDGSGNTVMRGGEAGPPTSGVTSWSANADESTAQMYGTHLFVEDIPASRVLGRFGNLTFEYLVATDEQAARIDAWTPPAPPEPETPMSQARAILADMDIDPFSVGDEWVAAEQINETFVAPLVIDARRGLEPGSREYEETTARLLFPQTTAALAERDPESDEVAMLRNVSTEGIIAYLVRTGKSIDMTNDRSFLDELWVKWQRDTGGRGALFSRDEPLRNDDGTPTPLGELRDRVVAAAESLKVSDTQLTESDRRHITRLVEAGRPLLDDLNERMAQFDLDLEARIDEVDLAGEVEALDAEIANDRRLLESGFKKLDGAKLLVRLANETDWWEGGPPRPADGPLTLKSSSLVDLFNGASLAPSPRWEFEDGVGNTYIVKTSLARSSGNPTGFNLSVRTLGGRERAMGSITRDLAEQKRTVKAWREKAADFINNTRRRDALVSGLEFDGSPSEARAAVFDLLDRIPPLVDAIAAIPDVEVRDWVEGIMRDRPEWTGVWAGGRPTWTRNLPGNGYAMLEVLDLSSGPSLRVQWNRSANHRSRQERPLGSVPADSGASMRRLKAATARVEAYRRLDAASTKGADQQRIDAAMEWARANIGGGRRPDFTATGAAVAKANELEDIVAAIFPSALVPDGDLGVETKARVRAYYRRGSKIVVTPDEDFGTLLHEYAHHVEWSNPEVARATWAFYQHRTAGEKLQSLRRLSGGGYRSDEKARPDKFYSPYAGKSYGDGVDGRRPSFRTTQELFTMGLQGIFDPKTRKRYDSIDAEYAAFILGILALHSRNTPESDGDAEGAAPATGGGG